MNRRAVSWAVLVLSLSALLSSCDQSFNPKSRFEQELVVFSILSNARDTQYVRVSTTYDVPGFDPAKHQTDEVVEGARVVVTGPLSAYDFKQISLPRNDKSRYNTPIQAYLTSPFRPNHGVKYDLTVRSTIYGEAAATVTIPDSALIGFDLGTSLLDKPEDREPNSSIVLQALVSPFCKGYLAQMFVDYQVRVDSSWTDERIEVPTRVIADTLNLWVVTYPSLTRKVVRQTGTSFAVKAYVATLYRIIKQNPKKKIAFRRVVGRVLQCEQGLYDYYNTVNGFRDPVSIRVDLPEYSNISGAKGVFGAYALDSLTHILPDNFGLNIK